MSARITIIDYGVGNLLNVVRAVEHCGGEALVTEDTREVEQAERLMLMGVGAFADGMEGLRRLDMLGPIQAFCATGRPYFGVCVGMQMMFDYSEEFGHHEGLGLMPGAVVAVPPTGSDGRPHKVPHIGWNELRLPPGRQDWSASPLAEVVPGRPCYFVHSFMAEPREPGHRLADVEYNGRVISAAVQKDNLFGFQFHPEKSGPQGLAIVRGMLAI